MMTVRTTKSSLKRCEHAMIGSTSDPWVARTCGLHDGDEKSVYLVTDKEE